MAEAIEKVLRIAGRRAHLNVLLEQVGWSLALGAVAAGAAVLVQRVLGVQFIAGWTVWGLAGAVALAAGTRWWWLRPSRMGVAVMVDGRLMLRERFSTVLATQKSADPFARAVERDTRDVARRLRVGGHFPIRLSRRWLHAAGLWAIVIALAALMPEVDLFGRMADKAERALAVREFDQAKEDVKMAKVDVAKTIDKLNDPKLAAELAALNAPMTGVEPAAVRREAISKLTNLSEQVRQLQKDQDLQAVQAMQRMLKQLRGARTGSELSKLRNALAKGDFAQAGKALQEFREKLDTDQFDTEQAKKLAEQLAKLGEQLKKVGDEKQAAEDALASEGLDKSLAKLDQDQLRKALQGKGLSDEKIQQLMNKLAGLQTAARQCDGLGQSLSDALAIAGSLSEADLSELGDQLSDLEAMQQRLAAAEAALDEIDQAIARLGEGQGPGQGIPCSACQGQGCSQCQGAGLGPGQGGGYRPTATSGNFGTKKTLSPSASSDEAPAIASWYIKGTQVKGGAEQKFREAVHVADKGFAEALKDKRVPRKYEGPVKDYFGGLEKAGRQKE